ncbi:30S ribosomal protein S27e [Sulfolobales archaeon HS-7]|nr:30S ribosomal protein S27e [Sulfolobales archaeon HS-7]
MKKSRIPIPEPKSKFLRIKCPNCSNEQVVFSHSSFQARCTACGTILIESRGGQAKILGEIVKVMA